MKKKKDPEFHKARRLELKRWFREEYLPIQKCQCGESHPACIDFHHIDPTTKDRSIARILHDTRSKNTLLKELAKCVAICANCHRKLHYEEMNNGVVELGYNQYKLD